MQFITSDATSVFASNTELGALSEVPTGEQLRQYPRWPYDANGCLDPHLMQNFASSLMPFPHLTQKGIVPCETANRNQARTRQCRSANMLAYRISNAGEANFRSRRRNIFPRQYDDH